MKKRIGKFFVTKELLEGNDNLHEILGFMKFIPYRVEYLKASEKSEYIGTSFLFDFIAEKDVTPFYRVIINEVNGQFSHVTVEKEVKE